MLIEYDDIARAHKSVENLSYNADDVNSYHIPYAVAEMHSRLANYYTVPFSSNNWTAKHIAIELTYARIAPVKDDQRDKIRQDALDLIQALIDGSASMITDSGDTISLSSSNSPIYSSEEDYHPIFTVDDPEYWVADEDKIDDLRDERDQ